MPNSRLLLGLLLACTVYGADDVPGWLKDLTGVTLPAYGPKVNSVVLFNEENNIVGDSGRVTTTTRTAIRVLNRQGSDISFAEEYDTASGKVRDFRAWMLAPSGKVKKFAKEEIYDVACAENDVFNECRRRVVTGRNDAEAGAIFAYEATVERQLFSAQLHFYFEDLSPVRLARFTVTTPAGWEVKSRSFNGAPPEAAQTAGAYTWQMENLAPIEPEEASPGFLSLVPWVGVNLLGGAGAHPALSWPEAAKVLTGLNDGQYEPNDAIAAKANALIAGATTEMDKIRALARFAQQVNYVSIQVNVSKGGGYQPHSAAQVFQKLYGDCKDKANLMRSLLKAVGIDAFPVAIYSGDRTHVIPEWPSLGAFNHAIVAIRVGPDTQAPAVFVHPVMGRLLLFDPTDPYVPVGYLPQHEQSSLALIGAGDAGDLIRVPAGVSAAAGRLRTVDAKVTATGGVEGTFNEKRTGEELPEAVAIYRTTSRTDYAKMIERWVGSSIPGSIASGIAVHDDAAEFVLQGSFTSPTFAKSPQRGMLIFRAAMLSHTDLRLTEKTRKYPIVLDADALDETVNIQLPADFRVDELPDPAHIDSPFGKYDATWTVTGDRLVFKRSFALPAQTVPVAGYAGLRKFLDTVSSSSESPVVLIK